MGKQSLSLKVRLPRHETPRNEWRKKLHTSIMAALKDEGIEYATDQKLELHVTSYLAEPEIKLHDVDNRALGD
jgi:hypothetical protein